MQTQPSILELFLGEERLYEAGARNFLFIDVPPVDRAPACGFKQSHWLILGLTD